MKIRKKLKKGAPYFYCPLCDLRIPGTMEEDGPEHGKKAHRTQPTLVFKEFGKTWDPSLDVVIQEALEIKKQFDRQQVILGDTIEQLKKENYEANLAKTRLNSIIMILQSQPGTPVKS